MALKQPPLWDAYLAALLHSPQPAFAEIGATVGRRNVSRLSAAPATGIPHLSPHGLPASFWLPPLWTTDSESEKSQFPGFRSNSHCSFSAAPEWQLLSPFVPAMVSATAVPELPWPRRPFHSHATAPCLSPVLSLFYSSLFRHQVLVKIFYCRLQQLLPAVLHLQEVDEPSPTLLTVNPPWLMLRFREFNPVMLWWHFILSASIFWLEGPTFKLDRKRGGVKVLPS